MRCGLTGIHNKLGDLRLMNVWKVSTLTKFWWNDRIVVESGSSTEPRPIFHLQCWISHVSRGSGSSLTALSLSGLAISERDASNAEVAISF